MRSFSFLSPRSFLSPSLPSSNTANFGWRERHSTHPREGEGSRHRADPHHRSLWQLSPAANRGGVGRRHVRLHVRPLHHHHHIALGRLIIFILIRRTKPYEQDVIYAKIDHWTAKMQGDKSAEGSDDEDEVHLPRVERDDEEEAEMRVRPDDEEKTINVDNGKKKEKERMDE